MKALGRSLKEAFLRNKDKAERAIGKMFGVAYPTSPNLRTSNIEEYEVKALDGIVDTLSKSEKGAELLKKAYEAGYSINFVGGLRNCWGRCEQEEKRILLNRAFMRSPTIVAVLAHELRHAEQGLNPKNMAKSELDLDTHSVVQKFSEADAKAFEILVSYQLKETGDDSVWNSVRCDMPFASRIFEQEMETSGDTKKALCKVFHNWFDEKEQVDYYNDKQVQFYHIYARNTSFDQKDWFKEHIPVEQVVKNFCTYKDENYFVGDTKDAKFYRMKPDQAEKIEAIFKQRQEIFTKNKLENGGIPKGLARIKAVSCGEELPISAVFAAIDIAKRSK